MQKLNSWRPSMPITFESPRDRFGIGAAGSILGNALMQKNQEARENQRLIEAEQRKIQQQKDFDKYRGSIYSDALANANELGYDLSTPEGQFQFLGEYAKLGGNADPMDLIKTQAAERIANLKPSNTPKPTITQKRNQESAADWVNQVRDEGFQAQQALKDLPQLEQAIYSPNLENQNFLNRWVTGLANKAGVAGPIMNAEEQVIATYGKSLVTDLSNLKGLRLTDTKLRWLENAVPAVGKTPEANKQAFKIVKDLYQVKAALPNIIDQIIEENGGETPDRIRELAGERVGEIVNKYIESQPDFKSASSQTFDQLPAASKYKGQRIQDEESGVIYESNGTNWKKVK